MVLFTFSGADDVSELLPGSQQKGCPLRFDSIRRILHCLWNLWLRADIPTDAAGLTGRGMDGGHHSPVRPHAGWVQSDRNRLRYRRRPLWHIRRQRGKRPGIPTEAGRRRRVDLQGARQSGKGTAMPPFHTALRFPTVPARALYVTTNNGGAGECSGGCGAVVKLTPPAVAGAAWSESILHSFTGDSDGANPNAGLVFDSAGALYGTTANGGSTGCAGNGCGTVFKLTPPAHPKGPWKETILYAFGSVANDGKHPDTPGLRCQRRAVWRDVRRGRFFLFL